MDLAKVGEIQVYNVDCDEDPVLVKMNKALQEGWVIVSIKTMENREGFHKSLRPAITVFILGWPRHQQKPGQTHWADPALDGPPSR